MIRPAWFNWNITNLTGTVHKINGTEYLFTEANISGQYIELGPAITKTLEKQTGALNYSEAVTFVGTRKMLLNGPDLYIIDGV
jgi:hypothetical protein